MVKQPSFQFYPGDWLKDAELRVCSHFARGLLVDLLCIMFEAKHRGRLCRPDGETPWTDEQIVDTSAGGSREDKLAALAELEANGVLKRDSSGILYSARLIRDEEIREERRESGSKGGSKTQANRKQTPEQTEQQKQSSSSSSSSSSSCLNSTHTHKATEDSPIVKQSKELKEALSHWNAYWTETHGCGRPDSQIRVETMLGNAMSAGWTEAKIIQSIHASIGWNAKTWRDPEADHDKLAIERSKKNGRKEPSPESERC
jgi:hypothetical protein